MTAPTPSPIPFRADAKTLAKLRQVAVALNMSRSQVVRHAVENFLAQPGVQRLATMSLEDRVLHEVENIRAGRHQSVGIEYR